MIDTIGFRLNWSPEIKKYLHLNESKRPSDKNYYELKLKKSNFRIWQFKRGDLNDSSAYKFEDSLSADNKKYPLVNTPYREDLDRLEAVWQTLRINPKTTLVERLDLAINIELNCKVRAFNLRAIPPFYYHYHGRNKFNTVYFNGYRKYKGRTLVFYNKKKHLKKKAEKKGVEFPEQIQGKNLLRLELRLTKKFFEKGEFKGITISDLQRKEIKKRLINLWYEHFSQVKLIQGGVPLFNNIGSFNQFIDLVALHSANNGISLNSLYEDVLNSEIGQYQKTKIREFIKGIDEYSPIENEVLDDYYRQVKKYRDMMLRV